jgi:hypothetical protein
MTDRLAQLEAETVRLRRELDAMQARVEGNDAFANGTRAVLLRLLTALRGQTSLDDLRTWMQKERAQYDEYLRTGDAAYLDAQSPEWVESIAKMAAGIWPDLSALASARPANRRHRTSRSDAQ